MSDPEGYRFLPHASVCQCEDCIRTARERAIAEKAEARGYERGRRDFQFRPEGDNHHNATLCPYCSPDAAEATS